MIGQLMYAPVSGAVILGIGRDMLARNEGDDYGETVILRLPTGHALVRGPQGPARWRMAPMRPQAGEGAA